MDKDKDKEEGGFVDVDFENPFRLCVYRQNKTCKTNRYLKFRIKKYRRVKRLNKSNFYCAANKEICQTPSKSL